MGDEESDQLPDRGSSGRWNIAMRSDAGHQLALVSAGPSAEDGLAFLHGSAPDIGCREGVWAVSTSFAFFSKAQGIGTSSNVTPRKRGTVDSSIIGWSLLGLSQQFPSITGAALSFFSMSWAGSSLSAGPMSNQNPTGAEVHLDPRRDSAISAVSYQSASTLTESVHSDSPVFRVVEENGRTYHSYKEGRYPLPNDTREQNRSIIEHELWRKTLRGKLYLSPIERLNHVLDIGTGTGLWAFEIGWSHAEFGLHQVLTDLGFLALKHSNAQVIGTDLSPIQPQYIPTNCQFEIDDAEDEWLYRQKFSLIHSRANSLSFQSPETVVESAVNSLEKHGWLESQDLVFPLRCDDNSWDGSALQTWNKVFKDCLLRSGRRFFVEEYAQMFRNAGLANVTERLFVWPTSPWPTGPRNEHLRDLGQHCRRDLLEGLEAISLNLFTRFADLDKEAVLNLVQNAKNDFWDTKYHVYVQVVVTMGQKP
ncbi:methyltransferase domain-containing protein [Seiridium cupressi]